GSRIPLTVHEVPTGTRALDWVIPDEWNIRDAYVATADGERVIDFRASNLHVVSYSEPVRTRMRLEELRPRLHVHETRPEWVPYRTSYYERSWGFCAARATLDALPEGTYEVVVDSMLGPGSLTYGECYLPGATEDEVLLSTHVCHPSLANDNLSGIVVLSELASALASERRRLSYRILFAPGTIGSIVWLARNEDRLHHVRAGLVLACLGDAAALTYKRSRQGDARVDRAAAHVVAGRGGRVLDFTPWGWDERQFNSPGFALPVGCLTRSLEGEFPEYHSSADNLDLLRDESLEEAVEALLEILDVLEHDRTYVNLAPKGEPQLGRRGLYPSTGGGAASEEQLALLWVLNQSDGSRSLLDVAERSGLRFDLLRRASDALLRGGLLAESE
ncbi:MAG: DUF4910 domain-containing protein, partial [Thermoleophilia bacterium]|nr:DUF4910 domain-containing protein [Gaiellaceae bacterium]MDW8338550.1 DUF4910 domain-containing protein [Thermoleophilia bacterium]